jgi:non-specific serine/threonine protein kinase
MSAGAPERHEPAEQQAGRIKPAYVAVKSVDLTVLEGNLKKIEKSLMRSPPLKSDLSRGRPTGLEIDIGRRELRIDGTVVILGSRAFDIMQALVEAAGRIVPKAELMDRVWPNVSVGDNALQVQVSAIRKALGPTRAALKTLSGRGYRLLGDWTVRSASDASEPIRTPLVPAGLSPSTPHANFHDNDPQVRARSDRQATYQSGECEIDLRQGALRIRGTFVPLGSRAFEILAVLVEHANELVSKDQLAERIWPGVTVGKGVLDFHVSAIRKALGAHRAILATISGRGYRLLGEWTRQSSDQWQAPSFSPSAFGSTNLPASPNDLVGRDASFEYLQQACSAYRIVTLAGPGGIGKTALAIELARRLLPHFDHGVWLVELASLFDPNLVPLAVTESIGLQSGLGPKSAEDVARDIGSRRILLVLDNCEHIIDAAAHLANCILRLSPRAVILATSRETLRTQGECVYRVPPLDLPPPDSDRAAEIAGNSAVQLFLERAEALHITNLRDENSLRLVAGICRQLDGIPLAIEFAAARASSLGLSELTASLEDRLELLTRGRRSALPQHRTMRATLDWSFALLPAGERDLLCRLAVFRAGFTLDSAVAVSGGKSAEAAVMDGIASLFDKSLVAVDVFEVGSRWRLLEVTRSYALGKLVERGEMDEVARHHASFFRDLMASALPDFASSLPAEELARYGREVDNVRAALDWSFSPHGDVTIGIDLTAAYSPFWMHFSRVDECRERCEQALNLLNSTAHLDARLVLLLLNLGVSLVHTSGHSTRVQLVLIRALEAADTLGAVGGQALALLFLHGVFWYRGDYAEMAIATERLRKIARQVTDPFTVNVIDRHVGDTLMTAGSLVEAQQCYKRVLQFTDVGGQRMPVWRRRSADHAKARAMVARALWLQGFAETARKEAMAILDEVPASDQLTVCLVLHFGLCKIASMMGDFSATEMAIGRLMGAAASMNSQFWRTVAQLYSGKLLVGRGMFSEAVVAFRDAFARCDETGWRPSYPEFRASLALALQGLGRLDEAENVVSDAIAVASRRSDGRHWYLPELLRIKAEVLLLQSADQSGQAEGYLAQALEMARDKGARTWELRVALSVARLRVAQGRGDEAKQMLMSVYETFIEGFETVDLKAAKRFLDAL